VNASTKNSAFIAGQPASGIAAVGEPSGLWVVLAEVGFVCG
jgi:hypothetical protein